MIITLKKMEELKMQDCELLAKWDNDEDIKHYLTPNFKEQPLPDIKAEELFKKGKNRDNRHMYFIMHENEPIGVVTILTDFQELVNKDNETAWISICIGEKEYWGKGISKTAMSLLEEECRKLGFKNIELGVFEFNHRAMSLYKAMGYKEIAENPDFTYYNGKWYKDIRLMKHI